MKRLSIFFGIMTPALLQIFLTMSCSKNLKYVKSDIGGLNNYFNSDNLDNKNQVLIDKADWIRKNGNINQKKLLDQRTILITASGRVNDQSFNQSTWEAVSKFSKEINNDSNSYFETLVINQATQNDAYDYAVHKDYKIWILTGFQQGILFKSWLSIGKNKENFDKKGIKIITVDWYNDSLTEPGRLLGLNFRTQEAAFVSSYSAAKLLNEINKENSTRFVNPYLTSFAGGDFSGATNFNYGFYDGLRQFNEDNDYKVNVNKVVLNTGFSSTPDARYTIKNIVDGNGDTEGEPQVILPVAGSLTGTTLDAIKEKKSNQWVIGVDTDQALAFPNDTKYLLTSIEKRIAIAVYKALVSLYGLNDGKYDTINIFKDTEYEINLEDIKDVEGNVIPIGSIISNNKLSSANIQGGYASGFVGTSKSTLNPNLKLKNGKTYAQRYDEILNEIEDEFYGKDKKSGRLNTPIGTQNGLKPSQGTINNFKKAIENNSDKNAILALKNVLFGYMTSDNLTTYFEPIISEINKRKHN